MQINFAQTLIVSFILLYSRTVYDVIKMWLFRVGATFSVYLFWLLNLISDVRVRELSVFLETVGGGHHNLAVGAGGPSFLSLRPSLATGEQCDNQFYSFIFQAGSLFWRLLIAESWKKVPRHEYMS